MPIQTLHERHYIAAILKASGASWAEISSATGLSAVYLQHLNSSPIFRNEVEAISLRMQQKLTQSAADMLHAEALKSVELLRSVRDDDAKPVHLRLKAADSILDRVPRTSKTQRHVDAGGSSVNLTDAQVSQMISALNDDPLAREAFENAQRKALGNIVDVQLEDLQSSSNLQQGQVN